MDNIIKFPNAEQRLAREILKNYEAHSPTLKRLAGIIDLESMTGDTESRTTRTHRNAFTFGERYGVHRDRSDSSYIAPTKATLDEQSNKLFTEKDDDER